MSIDPVGWFFNMWLPQNAWLILLVLILIFIYIYARPPWRRKEEFERLEDY